MICRSEQRSQNTPLTRSISSMKLRDHQCVFQSSMSIRNGLVALLEALFAWQKIWPATPQIQKIEENEGNQQATNNKQGAATKSRIRTDLRRWRSIFLRYIEVRGRKNAQTGFWAVCLDSKKYHTGPKWKYTKKMKMDVQVDLHFWIPKTINMDQSGGEKITTDCGKRLLWIFDIWYSTYEGQNPERAFREKFRSLCWGATLSIVSVCGGTRCKIWPRPHRYPNFLHRVNHRKWG